MEQDYKNNHELLTRIAILEDQLYEATMLMDAIKGGSIDAFVLNKEGRSDIYALESIDYTYRVLIEKFGEGALSISAEGLILYCNAYFSKLINVPITRVIGSYLQDYIVSKEDLNQLILQSKTGLSKGELRLKNNDGGIPVYISLTSLQPYLPAIGVIVTDQTASKNHEREIIQYQKELEKKINELNTINRDLEQFVHIISHDLKEPLRKIVAFGGRLKMDLEGQLNDKALRNLNVIHDATMRLNLLVDDLGQYSFSSQNKGVFTDVNLNTIMSQVIDDIEILISETAADIVYSGLPTINGSEVQMRQLFSNLIVNAIKYSKKNVGPKIDISSRKISDARFGDKPVYQICISDNGIGIEEQYLQKIFTIFQRLHSQGEYSGTGIGLAICKKIIENHKGAIEVESEYGIGSKFSLYLPVI